MNDRRHLANAIRALSMDGVQQANSGHPGAPMGMADIAEVLWRSHLRHNPLNPSWINRDRFVLSNGHGSMLIYSLLHLSGYDLPIEEIKKFRQLHSNTPGHPEYGYTPGIETTTGPLGQGFANAVGMAVAEKSLAKQFNREDLHIIDHYTYAFVGDGCMMEGISHEAASLAGTLGLGKLIVFWDDNGISIDGEVKGWFNDNTPKRFEAYGWHVISNVDGHDAAAVDIAIRKAKSSADRPTLICTKTVIGFGSPNKAGSHDSHGAPLGEEEIAATKQALNWDFGPFEIPRDIYQAWDARVIGKERESGWQGLLDRYGSIHPKLASEFQRRISGKFPPQWHADSQKFIEDLQANPVTLASRKASQNTIEFFGGMLPELMGGSADLAPSNLTMWSGSKPLTQNDASGNYIHYGVREFGMTAITSGIALHGGFIPYGATFLIFMEYARNAMRMAALMKVQNIQVYTHDSIGLGEDGPTHQPVEQIASLRMTPNMSTWRPCDQVESAVAWKYALERRSGPTALIFSRQNLVQQPRSTQQLANISKGGYIIFGSENSPEMILIATGSEVEIAVQAAIVLSRRGKNVRVVSMPSTDVFDKQDAVYKQSVLPKSVTRRIAIEAGITDYWYKYVGLQGEIIGMSSFGESAPASKLFDLFGFSVENVVKIAESLLR